METKEIMLKMFEESVLETTAECDWDKLLGNVLMNKVGGMFFCKLQAKDWNVPKSFYQILHDIHQIYCQKNQIYLKNLKGICSILKEAEFPYAILKGAHLISQVYPLGHRVANDIDILIQRQHISLCKDLLFKHGFVQGHFTKKGEVVKATRREILNSVLNHGETIPFIKKDNERQIEVDLNFLLGSGEKDESIAVENMLVNRILISENGEKYYTLQKEDFFLHLCCHFCKEATNIVWIRYGRDLSLYKLIDIKRMLEIESDSGFLQRVEKRAKELNVERECYVTISFVIALWPSIKTKQLEKFLLDMEAKNNNAGLTVYDYKKHIEYSIDMSNREWFLCDNRYFYLMGSDCSE